VDEALAQARRAAAKGSYDEALVQLWNAVEPARVAGDSSALRTIDGLAQRIAQAGDEAQQRDAQRLLEHVHETVEQEGDVAATARLDADVSPEGEQMVDALAGAEPHGGWRDRIGSWFWLLIVLGVILLNVLDQLAD
jgi:hypothetical protein